MLRYSRPACLRLAVLFCIALAAASQAAQAQAQLHSDAHNVDVYAGASGGAGQYGWQVAIHWKSGVPLLGIEAGGTGYGYGKPSQTYAYLVGPRLTAGAFGMSAFAHFLLGQEVLAGGGFSSDSLVYAAGGGVDFPVHSRLKWRAEADYTNGLQSNFSGGTGSSVRVSTGPVFRF